MICSPPGRRDVSVGPDDVTHGQGSLPGSGGHERLVRLQRQPGAGRGRQPGVSGEDGLQRRRLPETSVHPTGAAGTGRLQEGTAEEFLLL